MPFFYISDNNLGLGDIPSPPELAQVDGMLISRVHLQVKIFQHRGQQYKYHGHVVNTLRDTGSIYSQILLLSPEVAVIISQWLSTALLRPLHFISKD